MERSNFFNDEFVYSNDLNNIESTKIDQIVQRTQAPLGNSGGIWQGQTYGSGSTVQSGVYGSPADYLSSINLKCDSPSYTSDLIIYAGKALSPAGELITLSTNQSINLGTAGATYSWTGTPSVLNYVKIRYQETSGSLGVDDLGNSYATRFYGSYFIQVDGILPNPSTEILLATFLADVTGQILYSTFHDRRLYIRTITPAGAVILDPTIKTVSSFTSVEDHVNAKGAGTPTPNNPHGLTLADIGATDSVTGHRLEAHAAAIIDTTGAYANTLFNSYLPSISGFGPHVYISFQTPAAGAGIVAGGNIYFTVSPPVTIDLTDTSIFTSGDTYYWIYIDSTGVLRATTTDLSSYTVPDKFVLCSLQRQVGGTQYDFFTDLRKFYSTTQGVIRADFVEAGSTLPILGNNSTLYTNLQRIRYQLGRAINGNGGSWNMTNPPLTAGTTSYADAYHTHRQTPNGFFYINSAGTTLTDIGNLFYRGSVLNSYVGVIWSPTNNVLNFWSDYYGTTKATGSFAAVQIGTSSISDQNAGSLVSVLEGGPFSNADPLHTHPAISAAIVAASASIVANVPQFNNNYSYLGVTPGTVYHNTGSVPEFVSVVANTVNINKALQLQLLVGSSAIPGNLLGQLWIPADAANIIYGTLTGMVPAGWYFSFTTTNTAPDFSANVYIMAN